MICFLTSSATTATGLDPSNDFVIRLKTALPGKVKGLWICSSPDSPVKNDFYGGFLKTCMEHAGIRFAQYRILDRRNAGKAADLVAEADFIFLAGGHVPTQNAFFREIGLRELLQGFDGVLGALSAGSMNCAETVYAQPEEKGEAVDPEYRRFLPGLGLTKTNILPHYQLLKNDTLDGLRLFEDIAFSDSFARRFYCLVDGSYLLIHDGVEELYGEAYLIENGIMKQISHLGDRIRLS